MDKILRVQRSSWLKIRRAFPALKDETVRSYFKRLAREVEDGN